MITIQIFLGLLIALSAVSTLITEAIKQWCKNDNRSYSANMIALIVAIVCGGLGTAATFILMGIPFTLVNIITIVFMIVAIWIGAMLGYDKIIQLIEQLANK